jgi:hypothetical protein
VGKIAWHCDDDLRGRRAILPTRPHRNVRRVGNAPLRRAVLFNAAAIARCPPYEAARPNTLRDLSEALAWLAAQVDAAGP